MRVPSRATLAAIWRCRLARRRQHHRRLAARIHRLRRRLARLGRSESAAALAVSAAQQHLRALTALHRPTVTMYDSVSPESIPSDCVAFAGYVAGNSWPHNYAEIHARFPHAQGLSITLSAGADADVLDVEAGGATPAGVAAWVERQIRHGRRTPMVYGTATTMLAVDRELRAAGWSTRKRKRLRRWLADWDGVPSIPAGYVAKQFKTAAYDTSVIYRDELP